MCLSTPVSDAGLDFRPLCRDGLEETDGSTICHSEESASKFVKLTLSASFKKKIKNHESPKIQHGFSLAAAWQGKVIRYDKMKTEIVVMYVEHCDTTQRPMSMALSR